MDWISLLEVSLQPRKVSFNAALTVAAIRNGEGKLIALRWLLRDYFSKGAELALQLNANLERQVQERTSQCNRLLTLKRCSNASLTKSATVSMKAKFCKPLWRITIYRI